MVNCRWVPCLDLRHFVFGVGGWGYALVEELRYFSRAEGHDASGTGFVVLHPGTNISACGITRHIGKDGFGHHYHGTADSWSGGIRRNQLAVNHREYFTVLTNIAIVQDAAHVCQKSFLREGDCYVGCNSGVLFRVL